MESPNVKKKIMELPKVIDRKIEISIYLLLKILWRT